MLYIGPGWQITISSVSSTHCVIFATEFAKTSRRPCDCVLGSIFNFQLKNMDFKVRFPFCKVSIIITLCRRTQYKKLPIKFILRQKRLVNMSNSLLGSILKSKWRPSTLQISFNKYTVPESRVENEMAGKDWLKAFRKRNPELTLHRPEHCSLARSTAFNKTNLHKFYDNLEDKMQRNSTLSDGTRIYNL